MNDQEKISQLIDRPSVLLYFYNDACAPCQVLRPKVSQLVNESFPAMDFELVSAQGEPAVAAELGVFAAPTIIVFFDGTEFIRESKNISINELHDKIARLYALRFE